MDEYNNIYPCKRIDCDKYHKSLDSHALIDALYFLQFNRVINILDNMDYNDIISFRTYDKKNNILEYIFRIIYVEELIRLDTFSVNFWIFCSCVASTFI